jgi:hypothetical protein
MPTGQLTTPIDGPTLDKFSLVDGWARPYDETRVFIRTTLYNQVGVRMGTCDINKSDLNCFSINLKANEAIFFFSQTEAQTFDPSWRVHLPILIGNAAHVILSGQSLKRITKPANGKSISIVTYGSRLAAPVRPIEGLDAISAAELLVLLTPVDKR